MGTFEYIPDILQALDIHIFLDPTSQKRLSCVSTITRKILEFSRYNNLAHTFVEDWLKKYQYRYQEAIECQAKIKRITIYGKILWESIFIPPQITHVCIKFSDFDAIIIPLGKLPSNLIKFEIHVTAFDQPLSNLPLSLQFLSILSIRFNQPLYKLPPNLKYLFIASNNCFNQSINFLPKKLMYLTLWRCVWKTPENLTFPERITHLLIYSDHFLFSPNYLPLYLRHLRLERNQPLDNLPPNIIFLKLGQEFNQSVDNLPQNLRKLIFSPDSFFNKPVDSLPQNLIVLKFGTKFNQKIDSLPPNLLVLFLGPGFNQKIDQLPSKLKRLKFASGGIFKQKLSNLPKTITQLILPNGHVINHFQQ